ncbi:hypothetical protein [Nocardioides sp.]|uniref:hypothetical protein n=1 Tax=Nocardioides sp. TaxID=35761 RepID=UPI0027267BCF|nr:hypothetical protein [Nocardioides sp.]MDO9456639.1 hypothetical protein [Nocardioides sp.]
MMVDAPSQTSTAPPPPGPLGSAPEPAALQAYLGGLDAWVRGRRTELDDLDASALAAGRGAEVGSDMALALSLWKAVSDRYAEMWATWDGGRVFDAQRQQVTALVWAKLDGVGVSVPEACRLSDALASQLRTKLSLTPGADAAAGRIKDLRAQLERIRDQVGLEPALGRDATVDRLAAQMARLEEIAERARRGADVGGLLPPLEQDAAIFERDLIVGNQKRRDARGLLQEVRRERAALEAREAELATLVATCVATVQPAPRYAVPDVEALGPLPDTLEAITAYRERLGRVGQAMAHLQQAYAAALAEHTDLVALLDGYVAKARATGAAAHPDVVAAERQARDVLARRPAPMTLARQLVTTYQTWVDAQGDQP